VPVMPRPRICRRGSGRETAALDLRAFQQERQKVESAKAKGDAQL